MFTKKSLLLKKISTNITNPKTCSVHTLRSKFLIPVYSKNQAQTKAAKAEKETRSLSHSIMLDNGFYAESNAAGFLTNLPLGKRVINKLTELIRYEMSSVGGQEIEMPTLCDLNLWKKTGRVELMGSELFTLKDRKEKQLCLCPTHEEIVTSLVAEFGKQLPLTCLDANTSLRLYQITRKYRDESRPKHGLLRTREFLMKDMYTFHTNADCVEKTYSEICTAYETIFERLNLKYKKAAASVGAMGGKRSHEYHIESPVGEDKIFTCPGCGQSASIDLAENKDHSFIRADELCQIINCGCKVTDPDAKIEHTTCIEIGHTFILGDRYTKVFPVNTDKQSNITMGCYGIGVSRLMQACIESLHHENRFPNFPFEISPFTLGILPAKAGSKEVPRSNELVPYLCQMLDVKENYNFYNNILVDDRTQMTIGSRLVDMKLAGVPFVIVLGKTVHDERCEILMNSETMRTLLGKGKVECHTRETAVVLKQLVNDYLYAKKSKKLESYFKSS